MNDFATIISTVGFPIAACCALAVFVYKFTTKLQAAAEKRENSLLQIISEQGQTLQQIADVLGNISARLERVENILEQSEKE